MKRQALDGRKYFQMMLSVKGLISDNIKDAYYSLN